MTNKGILSTDDFHGSALSETNHLSGKCADSSYSNGILWNTFAATSKLIVHPLDLYNCPMFLHRSIIGQYSSGDWKNDTYFRMNNSTFTGTYLVVLSQFLKSIILSAQVITTKYMYVHSSLKQKAYSTYCFNVLEPHESQEMSGPLFISGNWQFKYWPNILERELLMCHLSKISMLFSSMIYVRFFDISGLCLYQSEPRLNVTQMALTNEPQFVKSCVSPHV